MTLVGPHGKTDFLQSFQCELLHLLGAETGPITEDVEAEFVSVIERLEIPADRR
jgi:hypothetical protein